MTDDQHLVVFTPSGRRGRVADGTSVLDAARHLGVDIDSVCGGRGICGRCQVEPMFGEFAKHGITADATHLSAPGALESGYSGRRPLPEHRRLSCSATVCGDLVVDVPAESQVHQQVVRKDVDLGDLELDPVLVLRLLEFGDGDDLADALHGQWGLTGLDLADGLEPVSDDAGLLTVAVRDDRHVVAAWPGLRDRALGVAVDVGSGGEVELTAAVREALDGLLGRLCEEGDADRDEVLELVLVGNPVMHHLLLGLDPTPLGQAPFTLEVADAVDLAAADLGLDAHPSARAHVLPCIAGHVGADTAGVVLATRPDLADDVRLVVDVGTNAEIVLAGGGRILAASSPTGPAFEGAQITAGQRATPGAIERVRIDPATGEPRIRVLGAEPWSDEPGFAEAVAATGVTGICGSGIIEVVAELFLAGLMDADGVIGGPGTDPSDRIQPDGRTFSYLLHEGADGTGILVTQNDIRAIQLAKAALYAGVRLLMDHLGVDRVDGIALAGAFGSHIDTVRATVLGLIPDCAPDEVAAVGNAAGAGAAIALLSGTERRRIQQLVDGIEKVETATEPAFQAHFVDAMAVPHRTADYPGLSTVLTLPARPEAAPGSGGDRRRRRRRPTREEAPQ